jgi:hypothetical protein
MKEGGRISTVKYERNAEKSMVLFREGVSWLIISVSVLVLVY